MNVEHCEKSLEAIPENQIDNRIEMSHRDYYIYHHHHKANFDIHLGPYILFHRPYSLFRDSRTVNRLTDVRMASSALISTLFYSDIHKFPLDLYTVNFYRSHLCITCIHQCLRNLLVPVLLVHLDDLSICNLLHICKNMFLYTGVASFSLA